MGQALRRQNRSVLAPPHSRLLRSPKPQLEIAGLLDRPLTGGYYFQPSLMITMESLAGTHAESEQLFRDLIDGVLSADFLRRRAAYPGYEPRLARREQ